MGIPLSLIAKMPSFLKEKIYGLVFSSNWGSSAVSPTGSNQMDTNMTINSFPPTDFTDFLKPPLSSRIDPNPNNKKTKTNSNGSITEEVSLKKSSELKRKERSTFKAHSLQIGNWEISDSKYLLAASINMDQQRISWIFSEPFTNFASMSNREWANKIRFNFGDVLNINFFETDHKEAVCDVTIDINNKPMFFQKRNSSTSKKWAAASDFTNLQASQFKRHKIRLCGEDGTRFQQFVGSHSALSEKVDVKSMFFGSNDDIMFTVTQLPPLGSSHAFNNTPLSAVSVVK